jgi:hypothetical protein
MSLRQLVCLVALLALVAPVTLADEETDDGRLVVRLFDVGALTTGSTDYIPEVMGVVGPDWIGDEDNPLFGSEAEEPMLALGSADELIELVKSNVEPVYWQITDGADMRTEGEGTLIVRAARRIVAEVARYLADLEADVLTTVTLEVRAVQAPAGGASSDLAALLTLDGLSVTLTALVGQQAVGRVGSQYAFVQDYDVEVAQDAFISDPIVGVANWGLSVTARTVAAPGAPRLRTKLDARLAVPTGSRDHITNESRLIELPSYDAVTSRTDLLLTPGVWEIVQGNAAGSNAGRWIFLVRATATPGTSRAAGEGTLLDPSVPADAGPLVSRRYDVSDLEEVLPDHRGWALDLVPSNFTPPEPPELAEPSPILAGDALPDLIHELVVPGSWNRDGTSIDVRYGLLFVTNTEKVLARVESLLALLRRQYLWTVEVDARLLELPAADGRELLETSGGAPYLLDDARQALLARALERGVLHTTDRVSVTSLSGARNAVLSGTHFSYMHDYEVEIAEKSVISNPVIQTGTAGIAVDLRPTPTSTGDAVNLAYQVTRTRLAGSIRQVSSPHGPIDAPAIDILRLRGNLRVPLGQTAVVGAGSHDGRTLILLVKPVLAPYGG